MQNKKEAADKAQKMLNTVKKNAANARLSAIQKHFSPVIGPHASTHANPLGL